MSWTRYIRHSIIMFIEFLSNSNPFICWNRRHYFVVIVLTWAWNRLESWISSNRFLSTSKRKLRSCRIWSIVVWVCSWTWYEFFIFAKSSDWGANFDTRFLIWINFIWTWSWLCFILIFIGVVLCSHCKSRIRFCYWLIINVIISWSWNILIIKESFGFCCNSDFWTLFIVGWVVLSWAWTNWTLLLDSIWGTNFPSWSFFIEIGVRIVISWTGSDSDLFF